MSAKIDRGTLYVSNPSFLRLHRYKKYIKGSLDASSFIIGFRRAVKQSRVVFLAAGAVVSIYYPLIFISLSAIPAAISSPRNLRIYHRGLARRYKETQCTPWYMTDNIFLPRSAAFACMRVACGGKKKITIVTVRSELYEPPRTTAPPCAYVML